MLVKLVLSIFAGLFAWSATPQTASAVKLYIFDCGTLKSGKSGKKVTSKKQAIAIGLSEARAEGAKVPKKGSKKGSSKKK